MNIRIICNLKLILALVLYPVLIRAKGGGAGEDGGGGSYGTSGSSSNRGYYSSGWVFWYSDGTCGQYCIITFSIVGVLTFLILLCGVWRCYLIKRYYKEDRLSARLDLEQDFAELGTDDDMPEHQAAIAQQYPPLPKKQKNNPPPSYDEVSAAPEESYLHGLRNNATWQAYKEGQKFNRENPPYEVFPPAEHIEYIITSGGPVAWRIILEESVRNNNLASVEDNGRVVQFLGKNSDKMVQTNYPLFRPQEYDLDNEVSPTSSTVLTHERRTLQSFSMDTVQYPPPAYNKGSTLSTLSRESLSEWFYYYEITILSNPRKRGSTIAIGLATKPYPPFRLPGWHKESVGWHSDDGRKFYNESYGGRTYSEIWGDVGDVIGCGYYPKTGIVFFTKNGQRMGNAFSGLRHIWFPTVGADNDSKIEFNFGGSEKEFRYREARKTSVAGPIKSSSDVSTSSLGELYDGGTGYGKEGT
ncbi:18040_t:CDS:2 [Acaulospora morrowiae]|uniref:18040_t:CDS:1 n=1 Tax=Acaulospora morrowiae TaxID=94023 RepID=A0A9N9GKY0_9GLOM|nr:18040_t:CDS:2 [Acaulospora morrowiae]